MKRMPYAILLAAVSVLTLVTEAAVAEGTLDKIERTGEFVIGYRADASPLSYENADGEPSGYSVDMCRRVASAVNDHFADADIKTRFVRLTPDNRISAVVDGTVDIECGSTTITLSRQKVVDFSLPTFITGGSFMSLKSSGITAFSDLTGKKIGVGKDTTTADQLATRLAATMVDAEVVLFDTREEGMRLLNRGDVDAVASDQIVLIGQIIESIKPESYQLSNEIFSYEPYGLVLRRNDADFRLVVNSALAKIYRSGLQADIFYKWIGRIGIDVPPIVAAMYQLGAIPE